MLTSKMKTILGFGGAIAVALGSGGMFLSGASVGEASGIVGLAFAVMAAILALIGGMKK